MSYTRSFRKTAVHEHFFSLLRTPCKQVFLAQRIHCHQVRSVLCQSRSRRPVAFHIWTPARCFPDCAGVCGAVCCGPVHSEVREGPRRVLRGGPGLRSWSGTGGQHGRDAPHPLRHAGVDQPSERIAGLLCTDPLPHPLASSPCLPLSRRPLPAAPSVSPPCATVAYFARQKTCAPGLGSNH